MGEFERDITSHRQATDDCAVDVKFIHQRSYIARHVFHRCPTSFSLSFSFSDKLKFVGHLTQAAEVWRYAAIATRTQKLDLFAPHRAIEREAVKKDDRAAGA